MKSRVHFGAGCGKVGSLHAPKHEAESTSPTIIFMEYQVIFERAGSGSFEDCIRVRDLLAANFRIPPETAEAIIRQAPVVVKSGLTADDAETYRKALESLGAIVSMVPMPGFAEQITSPMETVHPVAEAPPADDPEDELASVLAGTTQRPPVRKPPPPMTGTVKLAPPRPPAAETPPAKKGWSPTAPPTAPQQPPQPQAPTPQATKPPQVSPEIPPAFQQAAEAAFSPPPVSAPPVASPPPVAPGATADWWLNLRVLNPPVDWSVRGQTPLSAGRVTATDDGFTLAHPMVGHLRYADIRTICVFQAGFDFPTSRRFVDVFAPSANKPIRLDASFINFASFKVPPTDNPYEALAYFLRVVLQQNPETGVDMATFRFLRDLDQIKIVGNDKEVEKYCSRVFIETEIGNSPEVNPNALLGSEADDLRDQPDPWLLPQSATAPAPGPSVADEAKVESAPAFPSELLSDTADWWMNLRVIAPPHDDTIRGMTPLTAGRVTATDEGFTLAHPMVGHLRYEDIRIISVFQAGFDPANCKRFVDVFAPAANKPVRLDASFINFKSFKLPPSENVAESLALLVRVILKRSPDAGVDLATFRFLRDVEAVKIVNTDKEVEKYVARLFVETELGNTPDENPNAVAGTDADDLRHEPDPWEAAQPPPQPNQPPVFQGPLTGRFAPPPVAGYGMPPPMPGQSGPLPPMPGYPPPGGGFVPPPMPGHVSGPLPPMPGYGPPPGAGFVPPPMLHTSGPLPPMPGYGPSASADQMSPSMPDPLGEMVSEDQIETLRADKRAKTALILTLTGFPLCFIGIGIILSIYGLIEAGRALKKGGHRKEIRSKSGIAQLFGIMGIIIFVVVVLLQVLRR